MSEKYPWTTVKVEDDYDFAFRPISGNRLQLSNRGMFFTLSEKQFARLLGMQYTIRDELKKANESVGN